MWDHLGSYELKCCPPSTHELLGARRISMITFIITIVDLMLMLGAVFIIMIFVGCETDTAYYHIGTGFLIYIRWLLVYLVFPPITGRGAAALPGDELSVAHSVEEAADDHAAVATHRASQFFAPARCGTGRAVTDAIGAQSQR